MAKKLIAKYGIYFSAVTLLAFVRAIGTYVFIVPNGFAPGGLSGIASIIYNVTLQFDEELANGWFNPAVTVFILNVPLFIWAFIALDKKFAFNTMVCVAAFSVFMGVFSAVDFPVFQGSNEESGIMLLASIVGGAILGICLGFMLRMNTSLGGTDIIGKIIYEKNPILNVQWLIFICDCVVVLMSGVIGIIGINDNNGTKDIIIRILSPILYSFISLFVCSKAADFVQGGIEGSVVFNIVTSKPEEMGAAIVSTIKRGATIVRGEGVYTHSERDIVICVVRKKQVVQMKRLVKAIDPSVFMYITNTREVKGFGFADK